MPWPLPPAPFELFWLLFCIPSVTFPTGCGGLVGALFAASFFGALLTAAFFGAALPTTIFLFFVNLNFKIDKTEFFETCKKLKF